MSQHRLCGMGDTMNFNSGMTDMGKIVLVKLV